MEEVVPELPQLLGTAVVAPQELMESVIPPVQPAHSLHSRNSAPQEPYRESRSVSEPEQALSFCIRSKIGSTKELRLLQDTSFSLA